MSSKITMKGICHTYYKTYQVVMHTYMTTNFYKCKDAYKYDQTLRYTFFNSLKIRIYMKTLRTPHTI